MRRNIHHIEEKIFWMVLYLVILMAQTSCRPTPSSILLDSRCKPPCWQNIEPGRTSEQEVISILKNIPNVDANSVSTHGGPWLIFDDIVYFTLQPEGVKAEIFYLDSKVSMILFSGNLNITFGRAIGEFGEPEHIINVPTYGGQPLASTISFAIIALDPKRGIEIVYNTDDLPKALNSKLTPETQVNLIAFFDPDAYDKLLEAGIFSMGLLNGSDTRKYMRAWDGYGAIKEKYPPAVIN